MAENQSTKQTTNAPPLEDTYPPSVRIADLTEKLLSPVAAKTTRPKIADQTARIIPRQNAGVAKRQNAVDVLNVYMSGNET